MKIKCDFCKTEYTLDKIPNTPVKCAVCGNSWSIATPQRKNAWLVFLAALGALLSAIIFTVAVITQHKAKNVNRGPLVVDIESVESITDETGNAHIIVNGTVTNISDAIYGVPDLIIVSSDERGNVLAQQKFMPSATLLDAGGVVNFSHILSPQPNGVKKISAQLLDFQIPTPDKK